jgi:outer membrane protein OmpA-like peptidoglycan-associated protein
LRLALASSSLGQAALARCSHQEKAGALVCRRSEAVRKVLVEQYHIAPARLATAGFGASQPKTANDTPEGRAKNRRVELIRQ